MPFFKGETTLKGRIVNGTDFYVKLSELQKVLSVKRSCVITKAQILL